MTVEKILNAKPNTKEFNDIKKLRETRERAETLSRENTEIERRMDQMREELELERKEFNAMKEKHSRQVINFNKKIESMKDMLKDAEANRDNVIREQYRDRMEDIQQIINDSHLVFEEKANVVHNLNKSIVKKVSNYERVNEMKDIGKREAEIKYKSIVDEQKNQHKKEMSNLKSQYEYLLSEKEAELEKFVNEFKQYHNQKKEEIHTARDEIVNLYKVCRKQQTIIENIEKGFYTNGIRSAYIPQKDKPKIPDRYSTKFLAKALNKTKTGSTSKDWNKSGADNFGRASGAEDDLEEADTIIREAYKRTSGELKASKDQSQDSKLSKYNLLFLLSNLYFIVFKPCPSNIIHLGGEGVRKETLEQLIAERDKYKMMYQSEVKKNNNSKIVIESQKRLLERTKVESVAKKAGGLDMMRPRTQGRF